ncbi:hypothetical protein [Paenibacillus sp. NPDC058071]|uniref:hypothetical protein n=1 Tax=Paenibacillus sp. NPDC058071 TaxID=3346326 RepID=UPI0036DE13CA
METEEMVMTQEDYASVSELFRAAYPSFVQEIERVEKERGKLNDFQLMRAVSNAKESLTILNWDYRKAVNAIFDTYVELYKENGKEEADKWAIVTFGCSRFNPLAAQSSSGQEEGLGDAGQIETVHARIEELALLLQAKEAELMLLYKELNRLQSFTARSSGKPVQKLETPKLAEIAANKVDAPVAEGKKRTNNTVSHESDDNRDNGQDTELHHVVMHEDQKHHQASAATPE